MESYPALSLPKKQKIQWTTSLSIEVVLFAILFIFFASGTAIRILELAFLWWLIRSMLKLSAGAKRLLWGQVIVATVFFLSTLLAGLFLSDASSLGSLSEISKGLGGLAIFFLVYLTLFAAPTIVALVLYKKSLVGNSAHPKD